MSTTPDFRTDRIRVVPWDDPGADPIAGHDPRSRYVERFWLGILGPATTLFIRRAATELDRAPNGWWMDVEATARSLGLVSTSKHAPFQRALGRACTFGHAKALDPSMIAVRPRVRELTTNQLSRLPEELQREHARVTAPGPQISAIEPDRAAELARTLLQLGEPIEEVDAQLARWQIDHGTRQQAVFEAYQSLAA
ncbi:MAG: hypothetical protein AAGA99_18525 [Actinomycetota bacterium]